MKRPILFADAATHFRGSCKQYDGGDLYWLAEAVFNITRRCLLLHVGLSVGSLRTLVRRWPVRATQAGVLEVVKHLAESP